MAARQFKLIGKSRFRGSAARYENFTVSVD
jgi:hypothetical protein